VSHIVEALITAKQAWARAWPWAGLVLRLIVGGVWIAAGVLKLPDPAESVRAVRAYRILPEAVVPATGYGLPVLEVAIGALLVAGIAVRLAAAISGLLFAAYIIGISSAWARGLQIDCGCFGGGGTIAKADTRYPQEIARDIALLIAATLLAWWPRTRLALGNVLAGEPQPVVDDLNSR
jgi:uncharacterized membrane protein YphA (DoxX/SURF4 family)